MKRLFTLIMVLLLIIVPVTAKADDEDAAYLEDQTYVDGEFYEDYDEKTVDYDDLDDEYVDDYYYDEYDDDYEEASNGIDLDSTVECDSSEK